MMIANFEFETFVQEMDKKAEGIAESIITAYGQIHGADDLIHRQITLQAEVFQRGAVQMGAKKGEARRIRQHCDHSLRRNVAALLNEHQKNG